MAARAALKAAGRRMEKKISEKDKKDEKPKDEKPKDGRITAWFTYVPPDEKSKDEKDEDSQPGS